MYSVYINKASVNENWTIVNSLWIKFFGIKSTEFHNSSIFIRHSCHMLFSHSLLLGQTAVTVVQAALPLQEHSLSEPL